MKLHEIKHHVSEARKSFEEQTVDAIVRVVENFLPYECRYKSYDVDEYQKLISWVTQESSFSESQDGADLIADLLTKAGIGGWTVRMVSRDDYPREGRSLNLHALHTDPSALSPKQKKKNQHEGWAVAESESGKSQAGWWTCTDGVISEGQFETKADAQEAADEDDSVDEVAYGIEAPGDNRDLIELPVPK